MDLPETYVKGFHDENEVRKMKYSTLGSTELKVSQLSLGTAAFSYFYGKRRKWVHDINLERNIFGEYHTLMPQLRPDEQSFYVYFRMTPECFDEILNLVKDEIRKSDTNYREAISPEDRLAITLRDVDLKECRQVVHEAIKKGINYIDTGPWYGHGQAEEILGKCLEGIPRKAYYLATKVGRYEKDPSLMFDFSAEKSKRSIENSLSRLGTDYVDVLQVHDIEFAPSLDLILNETLPAVQGIVNEGKAKYIGLTGYPVSTLWECIERSHVPINMLLSYCRLTMIDDTLTKFIPRLQGKNVGIVNAAAQSMGLLRNAEPPDWHPAGEEIKTVCSEARQYCKDKGVELGKLALYYSLQHKGTATVLVGMNNRQLLDFNLQVLHEGLSPNELAAYNHVLKIFEKLTVRHWENIEVENYRKFLSSEAGGGGCSK